MRILVTGGNGYVGQFLCRRLYNDHEVCVLDNLRFGNLRFTKAELSRVRFEQIDICNEAAVSLLIKDFTPEVIVHLAAIHFIPECESNPALAVATNVLGTVNLLSNCPSDCRFVFASSGAVYEPHGSPHLEDVSSLHPTDVYGYTKLQGEEYVRYFAKQRSFPAVIIRLFNVIGTGETNPHILPEIIAQLKAGRISLQLGNTTPRRDYVDVNDAAAGFAAVSFNAHIPIGETVTVNLGTQTTYSVEDLLTALQKITNIDFLVQVDQERIRNVDRPILIADRTKIRQIFGWQPTIPLIQTLETMWSNPDLPTMLIQKYKQ